MYRRDYITPRQLAAAIGVSESSLKRWTDRGFLPNIRTAGGHRRIPMAEVVEFLRKTNTPVVHPEILGICCPLAPGSIELGEACAALFDLLAAGDRAGSAAVVLRSWLGGSDLPAIFDQLIHPVLVRMGAGWERGEIELYQEHRAAHICLGVLAELRRFIPCPARGAPVAIGGAPPGDPYLLGPAMCDLALTLMGWRSMNLGTDTPIAALLSALEREGAQMVWLSVCGDVRRDALTDEVRRLRTRCDERGARLVVGGRKGAETLSEAVAGEQIGHSIRDLFRLAQLDSQRPLRGADLVGL